MLIIVILLKIVVIDFFDRETISNPLTVGIFLLNNNNNNNNNINKIILYRKLFLVVFTFFNGLRYPMSKTLLFQLIFHVFFVVVVVVLFYFLFYF